jgi:AcrR family transcriptional regulator
MTLAEPQGLRERKAQLTRDEILRAARRLFLERGYARTTVRDIARAAGVSAQTVYDSVGSKAAVVAQLNDLIDTEAGIRPLARAMAESTDPSAVAATQARITRSLVERCGDILHALVTGAATEPELAAILVEGHRRHLAGARGVVGRLEELGALRPGLDSGEAAETLAAVADFRVARMLQEQYGWSLDRVERWMTEMSRGALLAAAAGAD